MATSISETPTSLRGILGVALWVTLACGSSGAGSSGVEVGVEGGTVASAADQAVVIVPAGALTSNTTIEVRGATEILPGADALASDVFELTPSGTRFELPVTVSIAVPADVRGQAVVMVTFDEVREIWEEIDGSVVIDGRVYAQTTHFSFFGLSLPAGPVAACIEMFASAAPGTVHPLVTPNSVQVSSATKTATPASGFSGSSPLELGSTWVASQRFVEVTGNAGLAGEGGISDWSTRNAGTFTVTAGGTFSHWIDLHTEGPFFGLTDACLAPTADERNGWLYSLNIHCDADCLSDPATSPPGMGTCGPPELCMRSINMCGAALTQVDCEAWYMNPANCIDMPTYTTCNCACITEPTCTDYFDCGQLCFDTHCI